MMFREFQKNDQVKALHYATRQLDYIERMVDEDLIPENEIERVLNISSMYRHLIRFMNNTNERTAYAIKYEKEGTNYDIVKWIYIIAKVFLENDMRKEAKTACEMVLKLTGDYRLLTQLKETYNTL